MGASPGFLMACRNGGSRPGAGVRPVAAAADRRRRAARCRRRATAGSPSSSAPRVLLNVGSGGTDVCTGHRAGQPAAAGVGRRDVRAAPRRRRRRRSTSTAESVVGELGELVITAPMPSMPVGFWGDADGSRLPRRPTSPHTRASGGTATGCRFSEAGSCVDHRPLATPPSTAAACGWAPRVLPRRRGPARGRRQPGRAPGGPGGRQRGAAPLRRARAPASTSTTRCAGTIATEIRTALSPRHVPDRIVAVPAIPPTGPARSWSCRSRRSCTAPTRTRWPAATRSPTRPRSTRSSSYAGRAGDPVSDASGSRVAVVGTGVIGGGWAALFLARGLDVVASDPAPGAEERLRADVADALAGADRLGLADGARRRGCASPPASRDAVRGRGLRPGERPGARRPQARALRRARRGTPRPDVVLASSSSGLPPSRDRQEVPAAPRRVLVGHPFNPPHLIPLVEVVPGEQTTTPPSSRPWRSTRAVGQAARSGVRQEVPGHVANRLQAALWREAYSLVERGVASVADIDAAIAHGPGLRWALLGPFANQHLSGGPGGLAHILEHLGPPTEAWWRDLRPVTPDAGARRHAGRRRRRRAARASTRPARRRSATPCSTPCSPPRQTSTCPDRGSSRP